MPVDNLVRKATSERQLQIYSLLFCRPEELCLTFSCANGLGPEVDLVPEGSQLEVTSANWREYYKLMLAFKLHKSIQTEIEAVRKGLQHIVDDRTMHILHRSAMFIPAGYL